MKITNVKNATRTSFLTAKTIGKKKLENNKITKDENKKIFINLCYLGVVAMAGVALVNKVKKNRIISALQEKNFSLVETVPTAGLAEIFSYLPEEIVPPRFRVESKPLSLSLDEFKKTGKFLEGKAFVDDVPYNGTISIENEQGNYVLKYIDGILTNSTKFKKADMENAEPIILLSKTYSTPTESTKCIEVFDGNGKRTACAVIVKDGVFRFKYDNGEYKGDLHHRTVKLDGDWVSTRDIVEKISDERFKKITKDARTGEVLRKVAVNVNGTEIGV